jgi:surface antigen
MMTSKPLIVATLCLALAACEQGKEKQTVGTLAGAGLGALLGSQVGGGKGALAAIAVGTLAGAWAGSEIGKSLDKADKAYAQRTAQDALEYNKVGQAATWRNPDSGHSGTVTPVSTYRSAEGADCREFETQIYVDGKQEKGVGTACRQPDGSWKIAS